jgi:hypothetical protein
MAIIKPILQILIIIGLSQQCFAQSNVNSATIPAAYKSALINDLTKTLYAAQGLLALKASNLINSQTNDCTEFSANGICTNLAIRETEVSTPKLTSKSIILSGAYELTDQWRIGVYLDEGTITSNPSYTYVKQRGGDPILGAYSVYKDKIWGAPYNFRLGANIGSTSIDISTPNIINLGSLSRSLNLKAQSYLALLTTYFPVAPRVLVIPYLGTTYTSINIEGSNNNSSKFSNIPIIFNDVFANIFALQVGLSSAYQLNDSILLAATAGIQHTLSSSISNMTVSQLPALSGYTGQTSLATNVPTLMALAKIKTYADHELSAKIIYRQEVFQRIGVTSYILNYSIGF